MTGTTINTDFINSIFEFSVLTKITGKPNNESLTIIKDQLKCNSGKVQCELGGGNNGHLDLLLNPVE